VVLSRIDWQLLTVDIRKQTNSTSLHKKDLRVTVNEEMEQLQSSWLKAK